MSYYEEDQAPAQPSAVPQELTQLQETTSQLQQQLQQMQASQQEIHNRLFAPPVAPQPTPQQILDQIISSKVTQGVEAERNNLLKAVEPLVQQVGAITAQQQFEANKAFLREQGFPVDDPELGGEVTRIAEILQRDASTRPELTTNEARHEYVLNNLRTIQPVYKQETGANPFVHSNFGADGTISPDAKELIVPDAMEGDKEAEYAQFRLVSQAHQINEKRYAQGLPDLPIKVAGKGGKLRDLGTSKGGGYFSASTYMSA